MINMLLLLFVTRETGSIENHVGAMAINMLLLFVSRETGSMENHVGAMAINMLLLFVSRETGSIENHVGAMVTLLQSCLKHDLKPSSKDEDPPHAKIASDIMSSLFLVSKKGPGACIHFKISSLKILRKLKIIIFTPLILEMIYLFLNDLKKNEFVNFW